ncbi:MAG: hypothetical protein IJ120_01340 [Solobacterium sp.]|nr:hypothetical protein [Solobacterium sp.]
MLFQDKLDRARRIQREQRNLDDPEKEAEEYSGEKLYEPELADVMEKGDMTALILSAMLTILPVAAGVLLLLVGVGWLMFSC